ncbi:hypothetical protein L6V77_04175 [Myxococcota bacterium]|nr:hypothetical protein [Myxococcota bacterium]
MILEALALGAVAPAAPAPEKPAASIPVAPAPAAPFGPPDGPLRLSGGFGTGQLSDGGETKASARTGQAALEWLGRPGLRAGLAWRTVGRDLHRTCAPAAGSETPGRCPQGGVTGRATNHALALTAGLSTAHLGLSAGGAWVYDRRLEPDGAVVSTHGFRPAGHLRLGPADLVCLRAAAWDAGPETPGTGTLRAGVEVTPGAGRVLLGAIYESPAWGLLLAGQVPMGPHAALAVSGAAHPTAPARLVLLSVGVVLAFDPTGP